MEHGFTFNQAPRRDRSAPVALTVTMTFKVKLAGRDPSALGSWRPISIGPKIAAIVKRALLARAERVLASRAFSWPVGCHQYGFLRAGSTMEALAAITAAMLHHTNAPGVAPVALSADAERAFDKCFHQAIVAGCRRLGGSVADGCLLASILSVLTFTIAGKGPFNKSQVYRCGSGLDPRPDHVPLR